MQKQHYQNTYCVSLEAEKSGTQQLLQDGCVLQEEIQFYMMMRKLNEEQIPPGWILKREFCIC
jgi:hypothetical protein